MSTRIRRIDQDHDRFRYIIKKHIKRELSKYISGERRIVRKGSKKFAISIPHIDIPTFRYGKKQVGGVGTGKLEEGDILQYDPESGDGGAGDSGGDWLEEVDVDLEELAEILGEYLELPNIQPKGKKNVSSEKVKYTGISKTGPESLRHVKRTIRESLKRQLKAGIYDFLRPRLIPVKEDKKYRSWKVKPSPELNAVIFYIMDVSGSMTEDNKHLVRLLSFWIDLWLKHQYRNIDRRFVVHHDRAKEVDEYLFYRLQETGGTVPSTAFIITEEIVKKYYPPCDWNIYWFYFSDGDIFESDYPILWNILERIIPQINLFAYAQTESPYNSWGAFGNRFNNRLDTRFKEIDNVITSILNQKSEILPTIKKFLGKGN